MRLRWVMLLAAALAALALLGAACGGDDDDDTGADGGAATATVDASDGGDDGSDETPEATAEDDGDDSDSSADAVDACSLITKDEAEAALEATVGEGIRQDTPPVYGCTYETEAFAQVSITVVVFDDSAQAEEVYQLAIDNNDYPEIDGIGDRAYFALGFGVTSQQGRYEVTVDVIGPDDDQPLDEELAKKALDRLP